MTGCTASMAAQKAVSEKAVSEKAVSEKAVRMKAKGTFEVKMLPQPGAEPKADAGSGAALTRFELDKQYAGDLVAAARGEMFTAVTGTKGSAGYVAVERVTGTLQGRKGSFVLQHSGVMTRGAPQLTVTVVPDSGTGELVGLAGTLAIIITDGKHFYEFEYSLP